jgi:SAM-dependent methyltransferase
LIHAVESPAYKLCGTKDVKLTYREEWRGQEYSGFYCQKCDVYQTLGNVADLSPQYHSLTEEDLSQEHIDLLSSLAHRGNAFRQWKDLMVREGGLLRGRLLDIGCGVGGFLNFAAELGIECHGFDASAPQVAYARRAHQNVVQAITMGDYLPTLPAGLSFATSRCGMYWSIFRRRSRSWKRSIRLCGTTRYSTSPCRAAAPSG